MVVSRGVLLTVCMLQLFLGCSESISCKNENGEDVDWFILYKLPKLQDKPKDSNLRAGTAYAYLTSDEPGKWVLAENSIRDTNSMMGRTWKEYHDSKQLISHMFYNDEIPSGKGRSSGHLKGFFAFDAESGFWITHSIPKFPPKDEYEYPESGLNNGQHALCITLSPEEMNDICMHLLYCNPKIYSSSLSDDGEKYVEEQEKTIFSKKPSFIKKAPFVKRHFITSLGGQKFDIFSKDNNADEELYTFVSSDLKASLIAETWRRGAGRNSQPTCKTDFTVLHVTSIAMKPSNEDDPVAFSSKEDHSKWAIAAEKKKNLNWVCLADLNRMESQQKRGGGAVCLQNAPVWKAFRGIVDETDECPT